MTSGSVINLDEYAIARNTLLKVKGVPLMYLPIIYYPIQGRQRATGFLLPTYGTSTIRGQSISNAFFWAINRSQDATFFHDWFTRTGQGVGSGYRYIAGLQSAGNVRFYRFDQHETSSRHPAAGRCRQKRVTSSRGRHAGAWDRDRVRHASRLLFRRVHAADLSSEHLPGVTTEPRTIEAGCKRRCWAARRPAALFQRNETFNTDVSGAYGTSPRMTAVLAPQQLFGAPIYASMNSEYAYLPYRNLTDDVVTLDNSLSRVDIAAVVRVPLSRLTFLSVNTSAAYRTTYYSRSYNARGLPVRRVPIRELHAATDRGRRDRCSRRSGIRQIAATAERMKHRHRAGVHHRLHAIDIDNVLTHADSTDT